MSTTLGRRKFDSLDARRSLSYFAVCSGDRTENFSMLSKLRTSLGSRVTKVLLKSDLVTLAECYSKPLNPPITSLNCFVDIGKLLLPR